MKKKTNYFEPFSPRIVLTNIFMSVCVVIIVLILVLIAQGYSLGEGGGIERSGLLELSVRPGSPEISIDDKKQFYQGNFSKILSSGTHDLSVSKKSYDTWQGQAQIESGLVTSIDWIRLFPKKKQFDLIDDLAPARFSAVSPNHRYLLYLPENSTDLRIYNLQSDPKKPTTFNLAQLLSSTEVDSDNNSLSPLDGTMSVSSWNNDNDILSIKWQSASNTTWVIVSLSTPSDSINLTRQFHLNLSDLRILNDSATKLWALSDGELRILDTTKDTLPDPIDTNISHLASYNATALFVKNTLKDNQPQPQLYLYRENSKQPIKIKTLSADSSLFAFGHYWDKDWLAFTDSNKLHFLSGSFSTESNLKKNLKNTLSYQLDFTPKAFAVSNNQRIIFLNSDKKAFSLDVNSDTPSYAQFSHLPAHWLDSYLRYDIDQGALHVSDFDAKNHRIVLPDTYKLVNGTPAVIPSGSSYLYFFAQKDSSAAKDADIKPTQPVQLYRLHL